MAKNKKEKISARVVEIKVEREARKVKREALIAEKRAEADAIQAANALLSPEEKIAKREAAKEARIVARATREIEREEKTKK